MSCYYTIGDYLITLSVGGMFTTLTVIKLLHWWWHFYYINGD